MPVGGLTTSLHWIVVVALGLPFVVAFVAASFPPLSSCLHPAGLLAFQARPSRFQAARSSRHNYQQNISLFPTTKKGTLLSKKVFPSSPSSPYTFMAATPQDTSDSPTPRPLTFTTLLPAGAALLALAMTISHFTTEGLVERTFVSALVICSALAAVAYRDTLPFLRLRGGREGYNTLGGKGKAAPATHVLSAVQQKDFASFQIRFLVIQLMATFIDFIQGPYLYKVYENYGFGMKDIATLYLLGFASSAVSSPFAGVFADTYGRRLGCVAFALLQASSSLLLHHPSFPLLTLGRVLSGIATSFLATCFEAWMISEHNRLAFPPSLVKNTFSMYVFLMGVVAVWSGAVAGVVEKEGGVLAPFDVCALVAGGLAVLLPLVWQEENYGMGRDGEPGKKREKEEGKECHGSSSSSSSSSSSGNNNNNNNNDSRSSGSGSTFLSSVSFSLRPSLPSLLRSIILPTNKNILWVGLTQAFFEAAMFTWVFLWTPSLDTGEITSLNLGLVFATLMVGVMCGSSVFRILTMERGGGGEGYSVEVVLLGALVGGGVAMMAAAWPGEVGVAWLLIDFVVFEASVGVFYAAMGSIRARVIPETARATVMNGIRVLLNVLIVFMYLGPVRLDVPMGEKRPLVLGLCSAMVFVASACHAQWMRGEGTGTGKRLERGSKKQEEESLLEIVSEKAQ